MHCRVEAVLEVAEDLARGSLDRLDDLGGGCLHVGYQLSGSPRADLALFAPPMLRALSRNPSTSLRRPR